MQQVSKLLNHLPERHRLALAWFVKHAGTDQPWPQSLPDGTLLATKAKGTYKPNWTVYALSVRQTLNSHYRDRELIERPDGTWSMAYHQEDDERDGSTLYTNRGLLECQKASVPVGVLRQVSGKPSVRYRVLGLALVAKWDGDYFYLEGSPFGAEHETWG